MPASARRLAGHAAAPAGLLLVCLTLPAAAAAPAEPAKKAAAVGRPVALLIQPETITLSGPREGTESKIEDGTYKDGEVAFKVTRERNGQKFVIKYKGKVSGDTIKGKSEFDRDGETMSRDWEAKRAKD